MVGASMVIIDVMYAKGRIWVAFGRKESQAG